MHDQVPVLQLCYTTAFGWLAAFLYLRTGSLLPMTSQELTEGIPGSILPPLTSHVFCNVMGLPMPCVDTKTFPKHKIAIWIAHVLGVVVFTQGLYRMGWPL